MSGAGDSPELLDVQVQELSRALSLIAVGWLRWCEPRALAQADPLQDGRDRRERHGEHLGDLCGGHVQTSECLDCLHPISWRAMRDASGCRGAIAQTLHALLAPAL